MVHGRTPEHRTFDAKVLVRWRHGLRPGVADVLRRTSSACGVCAEFNRCIGHRADSVVAWVVLA